MINTEEAEVTAPPTSGAATGASGRLRLGTAFAALVAAGATLAAVFVTTGAADPLVIPGLPYAGRLTLWGLPVARIAGHVAAALTVGLLVGSAFLTDGSPDDPRTVSAGGYRMLRAASWAALAWAVSTAAVAVLTVSDLLGTPLAATPGTALVSFARDIEQGQAYSLVVLLTLGVAVAGRVVLSRTGAALLAAVAVAALLPPAFTGHAAGAGNHQVATTSLAFHVVGAALWAGGLAALLTLRRTATVATAAARYGRLALWSAVVVGLSGVANAWVRIGTPGAVLTTSYGLLVLAKTTALALLVAAGWWHRARTLPALAAGAPRAFVRLAAGELVVFAAVAALAAGLARTEPPVPDDPIAPDVATDLLGFPMPPPLTVERLVTDGMLDLFFLAGIVVAAGLYLAGVRRMRRAGDRWPIGRTLAWFGGLAVLGVVTLSGVARYGYVLFSVHMAQHMALSMAVPVLLVLGAPVTLALRTLRPVAAPGRGPREWLLLGLHSRLTRVVGHPVTALVIFVGSLYGLYFTPLFELGMRNHAGHLAMQVHFVLAGYLFFWIMIGVDPGPHRASFPVRIPVHFAGMVFHAFFGVALLQSSALIADGWYGALDRPWGPSLLDDQITAGGIAWSLGEIPSVVVLIVLMVQWIRADEREQRRLDRAADRTAVRVAAGGSDEGDALAAYNARLRRLAAGPPPR